MKTLLSLFKVSRELEQDSMNIDEAIRTAFVGFLNDAIVAATFTGGGTHGPTGLNQLVATEEEYTALSYGTMLAAQQKLFGAHVPKANTAVLHSSGNWGTLNTLADATTSQPIEKPAGIRDIPEFVADGVPTGISYTGDFSQLAYGFRHQITIERHPSYSAKKFGALWLAFLRMDVVLFRANALI